jgi:hypothetical protein
LYDLRIANRAVLLFGSSSSGFRHLATSTINCAYATPVAQTEAVAV